MWAASLREIKKRLRPLFTQERVATNAGLFLEGLLGDEQRKTGWMRAEAVGDPGPWRQQAILGRGDWDADALRDIVRDHVMEHLADDDAVLVYRRDALFQAGQSVMRSGTAVHPAFFITWCLAETSIETLVAVEGHRWAMEDSFETAKNEFGLDRNQSRSRRGWYRHVSLVMLAFAMMAAIRHRANPPPPNKETSPRGKSQSDRIRSRSHLTATCNVQDECTTLL
ncbi:SRSO17 transposase [Bradyrhizobium sp. GM5.1]